jgi:hypothetical protein
MIDAFQPEGVTRLSVDSIFMMPQLGVLSQVHAQAAREVFNKDCLIHLGTCIAPVGEVKSGKQLMKYKIELPGGKTEQGELVAGQMIKIDLGFDPETNLPLKAKAVLEPDRGFDVGQGKGAHLETTVSGGVCGLILDGRGRPFTPPENNKERVEKLIEWMTALDVYPEKALRR